MKKLIYAIGVSLFLAFMAFHVTVSLTNPYWGVSVEALAQGSGSGGSGGVDECPGGSCSYTFYKPGIYPQVVEWECNACCPEGKNPRCDWQGCRCE